MRWNIKHDQNCTNSLQQWIFHESVPLCTLSANKTLCFALLLYVTWLPRQCSTAQVRSITHRVRKDSKLCTHWTVSNRQTGPIRLYHSITHSSVHAGLIRPICRACRYGTGRWIGWRDALKFILTTWNIPLLSITAVDLARPSCKVAPLCLIGHLYVHWLSMWSYMCVVILWPLQYVQYDLYTIFGQFSQQQ